MCLQFFKTNLKMNESSYTDNSFWQALVLLHQEEPNLTALDSLSHLILNPVSYGKVSTFSNNTYSTNLTDNLTQHSSQLNLNLNLIDDECQMCCKILKCVEF